MLIRKKLTPDEFSPPNLRYSADCDCVQFSPDGGTTWYDQPANDPRTSIVYQLPPLTGSDVQCRAAEGMTQLVLSIVEKRLETDEAIELAGGILAIISFIPGFNVLYALILTLAFFAVTIAKEILEAAFDETTVDALRCIFYCNISGDGTMNQTQFDTAYPQLDTLNTIAAIWCRTVFDTFGYVGLTDAGVSLEGAADCDECECQWCWTINFADTDGGFTSDSRGSGANYTPGTGWTNNVSGTVNGTYIHYVFGETVTLTALSFAYTGTDPLSSVVAAGRLAGDGGFTHVDSAVPGTHGTVWTGAGSDIDEVIAQVGNYSMGEGGGTSAIISLTMRGIGDNPFGEDNC